MPQAEHDNRIESLVERLGEELVTESGQSVDPSHVAEVVHAKAEALADAPVQDFVLLLVEHEAVDELRSQGLHRVLPRGPEAAVHDPHDEKPGGEPWV